MFNDRFHGDGTWEIAPESRDEKGPSTAEIAMLVHDLRTPLLSILGMNEIASEEECRELRKSAHTQIESAAQHLLGIINSVLTAAREQIETIEAAQETINVPRLLADAVALAGEGANRRNIDFKLHLEPELPLEFKGDPLRTRRVLINLISNAARFSRDGTEVRVRAGLDSAKTSVYFSISDQGPGMTGEELASLFQPFRQIERISGNTGTGLGLVICKRLVHVMGGTIKAESQVGVGSTFTVTLPFLAPDCGSEREMSDDLTITLNATQMGRPLKILVVDDNAIVNTIVTHVVGRVGHDVASALSGSDALDYLSHHHCDLVLLDQNMSEMSGLETARSIRALHGTSPTLRIIGLTALLTPELDEAAKLAGMDACLEKTIRPTNLIKMIYSVCSES